MNDFSRPSSRSTIQSGTRGLPIVLMAVLLVVGLGGCGGVDRMKTALQNEQKRNMLTSTASQYRQALRWGHYKDAVPIIRPQEEGVTLNTNWQAMKDIKITGYEESSKVIDADNGRAQIVAELEYYDLNNSVVKKTRQEQLWWFDEDVKQWFNGTGLPEF